MRNQLIIILLIIFSISFLYCKDKPNNNNTPHPSLDNIGGPITTSSGKIDRTNEEIIVQSNNEFALDLYKNLILFQENVFFSPYSIFTCMGMIYTGAATQTKDEIASVFHFDLLSDEQLHPAINSLSQMITQLRSPSENSDIQLVSSNLIWGEQGRNFLSDFTDSLGEFYNSNLNRVNFNSNFQAIRNQINITINNQTNGKIANILPENSLSSLTKLVLTSAVYFKAPWEHPFNQEHTEYGAFHLVNGNLINNVYMMQQIGNFNSIINEEYLGVELPYKDSTLSMIIIMPLKSSINSFEENLTVDTLIEIQSSFETRNIELLIPEWRKTSSTNLSNVLAGMGMPSPFSNQADFSGMDGTHDLYISSFVHGSFINVDEYGTEASVATAGVITAKNQFQGLHIDHPFIYFIIDNETKAILFMGRILNPIE